VHGSFPHTAAFPAETSRHLLFALCVWILLTLRVPPQVLHNLKERYLKDQIYCGVGAILIAINPFKRLPLYTPDIIEKYNKRGNKMLPPHPFDIADKAYKTLLEVETNQSILVSGESGAGKTETTKQCLMFLADVAGSKANIEQRVLSVNPILEAFGNAKTLRNDNSSRFGRFSEIILDNEKRIAGAQIQSYLLEKSRVGYQQNGERNYHIFYQLCRSDWAEHYQVRQANEEVLLFALVYGTHVAHTCI